MRCLVAGSLLAACSGGSTPPPDGPRALGDFSSVQASFHASAATMSELVGVSFPGGIMSAAQAGFTQTAMTQAGVHHARADLTWMTAEPTRGAFDWSWYHTTVDGYRNAAVDTLPILAYGNPWANAMPGSSTAPPDNLGDFAAYAGAAATDFLGQIPVYEVWNEENLGFRFWQPREQPDRYGDLLAQTSAAVRAADPSAKVMVGGLIEQAAVNLDAETFLQEMYRARPQIAGAYDILAVHPYVNYPPAVAPETEDDTTGQVSVPRMIARLRAVLAYWGDDPNRAIWATEVGWPTYTNVSEELQARWTVRVLLLLAGAGVDRAFLYTMYDGPDPAAYPPEDAFGLFHYQDPTSGTFAPAPKLAWTAVSTLLSIAGPLAVTTDVTAQLVGAPADAHAYQLTGGARRVTIVWRSDDSQPDTTITVPVTAPQVFDMLGASLPSSPTIPLSGRPVYVVENP